MCIGHVSFFWADSSPALFSTAVPDTLSSGSEWGTVFVQVLRKQSPADTTQGMAGSTIRPLPLQRAGRRRFCRSRFPASAMDTIIAWKWGSCFLPMPHSASLSGIVVPREWSRSARRYECRRSCRRQYRGRGSCRQTRSLDLQGRSPDFLKPASSGWGRSLPDIYIIIGISISVSGLLTERRLKSEKKAKNICRIRNCHYLCTRNRKNMRSCRERCGFLRHNRRDVRRLQCSF